MLRQLSISFQSTQTLSVISLQNIFVNDAYYIANSYKTCSLSPEPSKNLVIFHYKTRYGKLTEGPPQNTVGKVATFFFLSCNHVKAGHTDNAGTLLLLRLSILSLTQALYFLPALLLLAFMEGKNLRPFTFFEETTLNIFMSNGLRKFLVDHCGYVFQCLFHVRSRTVKLLFF